MRMNEQGIPVSSGATTMCPGCGADLPAHEGPVHRYLESSPACWAKYGELLAREYQNPELMAVHRLTVDSFAVQHPGRPSPPSIQSVAVHLISLHAVLELGMDPRRATDLIRRCADGGRFLWLEPPASPAKLTVLHPLAASTVEAHVKAVGDWAEAAWQSWQAHHDQVRAWCAHSARRRA